MIPAPVESFCRITQRFGLHPEIYIRFGLKGHNGIDFTGPRAGILVPIFSPYDGEVWEVGDEGDDGYGRFVRVRTAPDASGVRRELVFGHLSEIAVKKGNWVNLGDRIGTMGNTGFSSAPHLHLGLRKIDANASVMNYNNGFKGYIDFLPFLLFWRRQGPDMVSFPYG